MTPDITDAELRAQYARTGLEQARGIPYEQAIARPYIRLSLEAGIRARRKIQAHQAMPGLHVHHTMREAA